MTCVCGRPEASKRPYAVRDLCQLSEPGGEVELDWASAAQKKPHHDSASLALRAERVVARCFCHTSGCLDESIGWSCALPLRYISAPLRQQGQEKRQLEISDPYDALILRAMPVNTAGVLALFQVAVRPGLLLPRIIVKGEIGRVWGFAAAASMQALMPGSSFPPTLVTVLLCIRLCCSRCAGMQTSASWTSRGSRPAESRASSSTRTTAWCAMRRHRWHCSHA